MIDFFHYKNGVKLQYAMLAEYDKSDKCGSISSKLRSVIFSHPSLIQIS